MNQDIEIANDIAFGIEEENARKDSNSTLIFLIPFHFFREAILWYFLLETVIILHNFIKKPVKFLFLFFHDFFEQNPMGFREVGFAAILHPEWFIAVFDYLIDHFELLPEMSAPFIQNTENLGVFHHQIFTF